MTLSPSLTECTNGGFSCTFCDLSDTDEVHFQECLVDIGDGKFYARLSARAEFDTTSQKGECRGVGGGTEGGTLPSNLSDLSSSCRVYLSSESRLRPGRHFQVSRLNRVLQRLMINTANSRTWQRRQIVRYASLIPLEPPKPTSTHR